MIVTTLTFNGNVLSPSGQGIIRISDEEPSAVGCTHV
jgi:hypothetical protein